MYRSIHSSKARKNRRDYSYFLKRAHTAMRRDKRSGIHSGQMEKFIDRLAEFVRTGK